MHTCKIVGIPSLEMTTQISFSARTSCPTPVFLTTLIPKLCYFYVHTYAYLFTNVTPLYAIDEKSI